MTEKELENQIDNIISQYEKNNHAFQFKKKAEEELARLLRDDTKPDDIANLKHVLDAYPDFDSVRIATGDNEKLVINCFMAIDQLKDPKVKEAFIKMILNLTR